MSLTGAIEIARTALATSQIGIQVAGNNMANAATPGYSRQVAVLQALAGNQSDVFRIGQGVGVERVARKVDEALQRRYWAGISEEFSAAKRVALADQLEGTLNELTGYDLSTELGTFFNTWSEVASLIDSRTVVIEQGDKIASFIRSMRQDLTDLRTQIETELDANVIRANELLEEIASLNRTITQSEIGQSEANTLRDQRDTLVAELSTLMDVHAIEDGQGNLDVLVGSTPVVLSGQSRGLDVIREREGDELVAYVVVEEDSERLPVTAGAIGGLLQSRDGSVDRVIEDLDALAAQLVFEVNKLHATATDADGLQSAQAFLQIPTAARTLAFNDPNNELFADLPFSAENGQLFVNVTNQDTGSTERVAIDIDLDGINNAGVVGYGDDTTPEDLRAAIDAVDGITATWSPDGQLTVEAETGFSFSFSDDSSGVLGVLGVNAFFTGTDAQGIAVRQSLLDDPQQLVIGRLDDSGQFIENGTALAIADLQQDDVEALGNRSFLRFWTDRVQNVATKASTAKTEAEATRLVRESLETQQSAISGVSIDEESINLLNYQRQFQGAAQLITVADELLDTLLTLV